MRSLLQAARDHLQKRGLEEARLDAELLLARALSTDRLGLYTQHDMPVGDAERGEYRELLRRRAAREPLAYILGEREFYGRPFRVDRRVLIPRPETELLVERALKLLPQLSGEPTAIDLGTGSGCIATTMLAETDGPLAMTAVDLSPEALDLARANAEALLPAERQPRFLEGDLFGPVPEGERFDLILSNPPYIGREEAGAMEPDVLDFEPDMALFSDAGRIAFHRRILREGMARLRPQGAFLLEFGAESGQSLRDAVRAEWPEVSVEIVQDLAGLDRFAVVQPSA